MAGKKQEVEEELDVDTMDIDAMKLPDKVGEETDEEAMERLEKETWSYAVGIFFYGIIGAVALGYIIGLFSWIAGYWLPRWS